MRHSVLVFLLLALASARDCTMPLNRAGNGTIPIGLVMSTTSSGTTPASTHWWYALCFAWEDSAEMLGNRSFSIFYYDDHDSSAYGAAAAEAMVGRPVVAVLGSTYSGTCQAMQDGGLASAGIAQLSFSASSQVLSDKSLYPTFMRTAHVDVVQAYAISMILSAKGVQAVATLTESSSYGTAALADLRTGLANRGIAISESQTYIECSSPTALMFQQPLFRMLSSGARVFVVFCLPGSCYYIMEEARALGILDKPYVWFFSDGASVATRGTVSAVSQSLAGVLGDGNTVVMLSPYTGPDSAAKRRLEADIAPHLNGSSKPSVYTYFAYDAMMTVAHAIKSMTDAGQNVSDTKALHSAMLATSFAGVTGQIAFDQYGDRFGMNYSVLLWRAGESDPTLIGMWSLSGLVIFDGYELDFGASSGSSSRVATIAAACGAAGGVVVVAALVAYALAARWYLRKNLDKLKQATPSSDNQKRGQPQPQPHPAASADAEPVMASDQSSALLRSEGEQYNNGQYSHPEYSTPSTVKTGQAGRHDLMPFIASSAPSHGVESSEPEAFVRESDANGAVELAMLPLGVLQMPAIMIPAEYNIGVQAPVGLNSMAGTALPQRLIGGNAALPPQADGLR